MSEDKTGRYSESVRTSLVRSLILTMDVTVVLPFHTCQRKWCSFWHKLTTRLTLSFQHCFQLAVNMEKEGGSPATNHRLKMFKNRGMDQDECRRRREEEGIQLRKQKREQQVSHVLSSLSSLSTHQPNKFRAKLVY